MPSPRDAIETRRVAEPSARADDAPAFLDAHFADSRQRPLSLLLIGGRDGGSSRRWETYFPAAKILALADASSIEILEGAARTQGPFDIVVDEGAEIASRRVRALKTLFAYLKPGGAYVFEDLRLDASEDGAAGCTDFLKYWLDARVAGAQIDWDAVPDPFLRVNALQAEFLAFYRQACLIRKARAAV